MKTLEKLAKQKTDLPILDTVLVRDGLAVATNLEQTITEATALPDGLYNGAGIAGSAPLRSDRGPEDFPADSDAGDLMSECSLPASFITDQMAWVLKAVSTETSRYYLNGICFNDADMVATDGHRLLMTALPSSLSHRDFPAGVIVPGEAVKLLIALVKEHKPGRVSVTLRKDAAFFQLEDKACLRTKYIDGYYPDYRLVVPKGGRDVGAFDPAEIKPVVKRLREVKSWHYVVVLENGKVRFEVKPGTWEEMDVSTRFPFPMGFNARYLTDLCTGQMTVSEPRAPVRIDGGDRTAVIMPLKI